MSSNEQEESNCCNSPEIVKTNKGNNFKKITRFFENVYLFADEGFPSKSLFVRRFGISGEVGANFVGQGARGRINHPEPAQDRDRAATFLGQVWDGEKFRAIGRIAFDADGNASLRNTPGQIHLETTPPFAIGTVKRITIKADGTIQFHNNKLTQLPDGVDPTDAVNKRQLDELGTPVFAFDQWRASNTGTNLNFSELERKIPIFGSDYFESDHFNVTDANEVECLFEGHIEVHCNLDVESLGVEANLAIGITKNDIRTIGTNSSMTIKSNGSGNPNVGSTSITKILSVFPGTRISIVTKRIGTGTTPIVMTDQSFVSIKSIGPIKLQEEE